MFPTCVDLHVYHRKCRSHCRTGPALSCQDLSAVKSSSPSSPAPCPPSLLSYVCLWSRPSDLAHDRTAHQRPGTGEEARLACRCGDHQVDRSSSSGRQGVRLRISLRWLTPLRSHSTIGIGVISCASSAICFACDRSLTTRTDAGGIHVSIAADDVRETRGVAQRICRKFEVRLPLISHMYFSLTPRAQKRFETYLEVAKQVLADFDAEEDRKKLIK